MTLIAKRKSVMHGETEVQVQHRSLIVEVRPFTVFIRQKERRTGYEESWESIFIRAAQKAAERARAERKARKKGSRQ